MRRVFFALVSMVIAHTAMAGDENNGMESNNEKKFHPFILIDMGFDPIGAGLSSGWDHKYSVRIGIGNIALEKDAVLRVFVEYQSYIVDSELAVGVTYVREGASVRRADLDVYATLEYGFLAFGLGVAFMKSGNVTITDGSAYNKRWEYGGLSRLTLFFALGLKTELSIGGGFSLPMGLYFNPTSYGASRFITPRIGIAKQF